MRRSILALLPAVFCLALHAQEYPPSHYINQFKDDYLVRLKDHKQVSIEVNHGELEITRVVQEENLFLDNSASGMGTRSIEYGPPFTEIEDVTAYTLRPEAEKDEYEKMKVRDIEDKEIISESVFYDGSRAKVLKFPSLQKGAITVLEYTEKIHEPRLVGSAIFQNFIRRVDQRFVLEVDEDVDMDIQYFNCTAEDFDYKVEQKRGKIVYSWTPKNSDKLKQESSMPEFLNLVPHIVYRVNSYTYRGETFPVLRNLEDLEAWYKSMLEDVRADKSDKIKQVTDSLVAGAATDREKVERIYEWVQSNIKYIAFEDGIGGFKPRVPSLVESRRYGDCKDMSCLTISMLNYAGLPAYHTWIGTRKLPYKYTETPSPVADNHMIAATMLDGELVFLDATAEDLPFGMPSSFIQGKQALVAFDTDSFAVKEVPTVPSTQNRMYDSAYFKIEKKDIRGSGKRSFTGYYADLMNHYLGSNNKDHLQDYLEAHAEKGTNKCKSHDFDIDHSKSRSSVSYQFETPDYVYENGDELILNMNLEKIMADFALEEDRQFPKEFEYTYQIERDFVLELPEGYRVSYTPGEQSYKGDDYSYTLSYQEEAGQLRYHLLIDVNTLMLANDQFDSWNRMIKKLNRSYNETIILKKS